MPIIKSAKKALRRDRRRGGVNAKIRRKMKQALKTARKSPTAKNLAEAYRMVDRAAKKGVVHKNKGARLKSRLSKQIKQASPKKAAAKKTAAKPAKSKKVAQRPAKRKVTKKPKSVKA